MTLHHIIYDPLSLVSSREILILYPNRPDPADPHCIQALRWPSREPTTIRAEYLALPSAPEPLGIPAGTYRATVQERLAAIPEPDTDNLLLQVLEYTLQNEAIDFEDNSPECSHPFDHVYLIARYLFLKHFPEM